jgi:hypothetical protein
VDFPSAPAGVAAIRAAYRDPCSDPNPSVISDGETHQLGKHRLGIEARSYEGAARMTQASRIKAPDGPEQIRDAIGYAAVALGHDRVPEECRELTEH